MRTYDNRIKYFELLMKYDDIHNYKKYELPEGFHYEFYKPGDEEEWVMIHIESGEFTSIKEGEKYFHDFYDNFISELVDSKYGNWRVNIERGKNVFVEFYEQ